MKSTEKDILIEKITNMPPEQVAKVLIFIAGLEAGNRIAEEEWKLKDEVDKCKGEGL